MIHPSRSIALALFVIAAVALALVADLTAPELARADAIDGPPSCPEGARGTSSHSGQWCMPAPCLDDAACSGGARCVAWRVCTLHASIPRGGIRWAHEPDGPVDEEDVVVGSCDPARSCTGTEEPQPPTAGRLAAGPPTCTEARYCVSPGAVPAPATSPTAVDSPSSTTPAATGSSTPTTNPSSSSSCAAGVSAPRGARGVMLSLFLVVALAWRRRSGAPSV